MSVRAAAPAETNTVDSARQRGHWSRLQLALIGLLVLFQVADLATFALFIGNLGLGAEQNPLARAVYSQAGLIGLALIKGLAIWAILTCFVYLFPRDRLSTVLIVICVAFSSVGAISNVRAYYNAPHPVGAAGHLVGNLHSSDGQICGVSCVAVP